MKCNLRLGDVVRARASLRSVYIIDLIGEVRGLAMKGKRVEVWIKYPGIRALVKVDARHVDRGRRHR